jgi:outer membrane protein
MIVRRGLPNRPLTSRSLRRIVADRMQTPMSTTVADMLGLPVALSGRARAGMLLAVIVGLLGLGREASAQQRIGYIDSQSILDQVPEYASVQQKLDQLEKQWRSEIQSKKAEVQALKEEYRAWELLYTKEERRKKQKEITRAQRSVEQLRKKYFGPDGQLYTRQKELMRPIQERILKATEEVATEQGYDYVFDKGKQVLFMYAREDHNLNEAVLQKLGVSTTEQAEGE